MAGFSLSEEAEKEMMQETMNNIGGVLGDLSSLYINQLIDKEILIDKYNKEFIPKLKINIEKIREEDHFRSVLKTMCCGESAEANGARIEDKIVELYLTPVSSNNWAILLGNSLNDRGIMINISDIVDNNRNYYWFRNKIDENFLWNILEAYWIQYLDTFKEVWKNNNFASKEVIDKAVNTVEKTKAKTKSEIGNLSSAAIEELASNCKSVFD